MDVLSRMAGRYGSARGMLFPHRGFNAAPRTTGLFYWAAQSSDEGSGGKEGDEGSKHASVAHALKT